MTNYAWIISLLLYHYLLNFHFTNCIKAYLPFVVGQALKFSVNHRARREATHACMQHRQATCCKESRRPTQKLNFLYQFFISIDGLQHCKPQRKQHNNLIIHHSVKFIQNPWLHSLMYIYYWSTYRAASTPGQGCNLISDGRMMYSAQKPVTSYVRRLRSAFVSQKVSKYNT